MQAPSPLARQEGSPQWPDRLLSLSLGRKCMHGSHHRPRHNLLLFQLLHQFDFFGFLVSSPRSLSVLECSSAIQTRRCHHFLVSYLSLPLRQFVLLSQPHPQQIIIIAIPQSCWLPSVPAAPYSTTMPFPTSLSDLRSRKQICPQGFH